MFEIVIQTLHNKKATCSDPTHFTSTLKYWHQKHTRLQALFSCDIHTACVQLTCMIQASEDEVLFSFDSVNFETDSKRIGLV